MAINCWSFGSGSGPGCVPGYYQTWSIDNIGNNPLLPVPTYITHSFSACLDYYQLPPYHEEARKWWTHFCDPPRNAYPITNIGSWPTTPTPHSMDITRAPSTAALPDYYLDRGFAIACRVIPTSKCLPYIVFHYAYNQAVDTRYRIIWEY